MRLEIRKILCKGRRETPIGNKTAHQSLGEKCRALREKLAFLNVIKRQWRIHSPWAGTVNEESCGDVIAPFVAEGDFKPRVDVDYSSVSYHLPSVPSRCREHQLRAHAFMSKICPPFIYASSLCAPRISSYEFLSHFLIKSEAR